MAGCCRKSSGASRWKNRVCFERWDGVGAENLRGVGCRMHSLCFSGVHCIICDVRFQMEKNIQASETAGGASLAVDLPECSF